MAEEMKAAVNPDEQPAPVAEKLVLTSPVAHEQKGVPAYDDDKNAAAKEASHSPYSVTVGQVYDGPLDLLLDLIRKQNIDIYDIPIALITAQFLDYCQQLRETDVDAAGVFIY